MTAGWVRLEVTLSPELAEGVAEALAAVGQGLVDEPAGGSRRLVAWLPADDTVQRRLDAVRGRIHALRAAGLAGKAEISLRPAAAEDWAEAWRAHFRVERITNRLVIVPSWERYSAQPGEQVIVLDPGMAFGTGQHPTTRGCLQVLSEIMQPGWRVIDVGTGSGILAVAAAKLGAGRVLGLEVDSSALAAAAENVRRNGVEGVVELRQSDLLAAAVGPPADLIVANIVAEAIVQLAAPAAQWLRPGGWLVASGVVSSKEAMVTAALAGAGLAVSDVRREGEWVTLAARRPAES